MSAAVPTPVHRAKLSLYRRVRFWIRRQTKSVLVGALVLFMAGLGFCGYYYFIKLPREHARQEITQQWYRFDLAVKESSEDDMRAALAKISKLNPNEPFVASRLSALDTGEADPHDDYMLRITTRRMHTANRMADAEREASKYLEHHGNKDAAFTWYARCVRVQAALERGQTDAAVAELNALPPPATASLSPGGLLFAIDLFRQAKVDPAPLHTYLQEHLIGFISHNASLRTSNKDRLQLLQCYLEGYQAVGQRNSRFCSGLAGVFRLASKSTEEAETLDLPTLIRHGMIFNQLYGVLVDFRRTGQITDEQYRTFRDNHEERIRRVWQLVLERDARNIDALHGLALVHWRAKEYPRVKQLVERGLAVQGENPALLALLAELLRQENKPLEAIMMLGRAAEKRQDDVRLWLLLGESAQLANRRAIALDAFEKAREVAPKSPQVMLKLAQMSLETGDDHAAVQLMNSLGLNTILSDPLTTIWYGRCLMSAGLSLRVPEFLKAAEEASARIGTPEIVSAAIRGICEGKYDAAVMQLAGTIAQRTLNNPTVSSWHTDANALLSQSVVYYRIAEQSEPRWSDHNSDSAIRALERARRELPGSTEIASRLIWLRLKSKRNPSEITADAKPLLLAIETGFPLDAFESQALGAALIFNGKLDDAVKVLEAARDALRSHAGVRIQLALAYHKQGKKKQALNEIDVVSGLTHSPQERDDYLAVQTILTRE